LPDNLILEQKHRAEEFIRAHANVFSRTEFGINRTKLRPYSVDIGPRLTPFQQLLDAAAVARGCTDMSIHGLRGSCDSCHKRQLDKMPQFAAVVIDMPTPAEHPPIEQTQKQSDCCLSLAATDTVGSAD